MPSEADFPYNPELRVENLRDLEKLRCVRDRAMAQTLYELWFKTIPNEPEMPKVEEYDPSGYGDFEPDLNDLHSTAKVRAEMDRANATVFYSLEKFSRDMDDREAEIGRRYSRKEREAHEAKFRGQLRALYGLSAPTQDWLARKADWESRKGARSSGVAGQ